METSKIHKISVVGGGLAGSECALQLADMGYQVHLFEMRDKVMTPAHKTNKFAELVCSNSFGSMSDGSAPQQLKWEAEKLNSHILQEALKARVPAGQALGMDREVFSQLVSDKIKSHANITIHHDVIESLEQIPRPAVIATGPLTHENLAKSMQQHFGDEFLYFFDAIAPIIDADTINTEIAWKADRYDKGTPDYFNCPLNKEEYENFIREVSAAKKIEPKHFETTDFFEGCMPIEVMVERGPETLRFGPMKPVGLKDPRTGREPWAVVQLRMDNKDGTAYNIVGFQTRMAYGEQVRVLRMIPGLEQAEFLKLGSIHRNLYINSPKRLQNNLSSKNDEWLFFAGQITGVEGYFESTCTGLLAAKFLDAKIKGIELPPPPRASAMGSLMDSITDPVRANNFQPTNINFGLFPGLTVERLLAEGMDKKSAVQLAKDKKRKKDEQIRRAREAFSRWLEL